MYTDCTILTFGRYKFCKLRNIQASYLLKLDNGILNHDIELREYIEKNRDKLKKSGNLPMEIFAPLTQ